MQSHITGQLSILVLLGMIYYSNIEVGKIYTFVIWIFFFTELLKTVNVIGVCLVRVKHNVNYNINVYTLHLCLITLIG